MTSDYVVGDQATAGEILAVISAGRRFIVRCACGTHFTVKRSQIDYRRSCGCRHYHRKDS